jgi:hypothetical protein
MRMLRIVERPRALPPPKPPELSLPTAVLLRTLCLVRCTRTSGVYVVSTKQSS